MSESPFNFGSYPEDEFFQRVRRQVGEDHQGIRERNRRRREVWASSPAMQIASNLIQGPFGLEPEGEAEYADMLKRLSGALRREPLVARYENHLAQPNIVHRANTEWWHALGHQYIVTLAWTIAQSRKEAQDEGSDIMPVILDERLWSTDAFKGVGPREIAFEWAGRVMEAKTYLWHQNTLDASLAAPLVPHVVQMNALPFDSLFFSFEYAAFNQFRTNGSVVQRMDDGSSEDVACQDETWWMLLSRLGDAGFMLAFDRQFHPIPGHGPKWVPQAHFIMEPVAWGARWPEDFEQRPHREYIGAALRMLAFMQAPFVDTTLMERKLPRPIRREYDRAQKQAPLKEVSVITLRASLYEPTYRNGDTTEGNGRQYSHSWWVNGHYRWQWFPREKTHRLIAIAPYMKQVGKPLLAQIRDVSR